MKTNINCSLEKGGSRLIVAVHQPNYLPYLGFFDKMRKSDLFVIYDDTQFEKGVFQHRNKIRIYSGWKWLTVPVEKKFININEVMIRHDVKISGINWSEYHFREIHNNYRESPYYTRYEEELRSIYESEYQRLIDLNMRITYFLMQAFGIHTKIIYSSQLGIESKSTQALVDIVKKVGGDVYLSGPSGRNYLDLSLFKDIKVDFQEFKHPIYKQCYKGFIPNISAIDALFNLGVFP